MVSIVKDEDHDAPSAARTARELPLLLLAAGVIAFVVKTFLAQAFYIPSTSMVPQLHVNDRVVVSKVSYRLHEPRRGDIVVFDSPRQLATPKDDDNIIVELIRKIGTGVGVIQPSTEEYIKRVIGLPGDEVDIREGKVYVNGRELIEPYLPPGTLTLPLTVKMPVKVPENSLWVMGDNRGNSSDSRAFGPISQDKVVGRTIAKVWPLPDMSFL